MGKSILVVGASRGLGRGLAELYAKNGWSVMATVRDGKTGEPAGVEVMKVDINEAASVAALHQAVAGRSFGVIFIVAGIGGPYAPIHETDPDLALKIFRTNAISPVTFAEAFKDKLAANGQIAFMTSILGSITQNDSGAMDAYRASKTALNMLVKSFSLRHTDVTVTLMHPGWVKTDMGGQDAPVEVAASTEGMAKVVDQRTAKGGLAYVDYTGHALAW